MSLPAPPVRAPEFGRDALIVCDDVLRIYQTGTIEPTGELDTVTSAGD
ncbi:hypothetical protein AB0G04_12650 [Actinoplanes sp. NPDC023801]